MEFIPLERYSKKTKNKKPPLETVQNIKSQDNKSDEVVLKKTKVKPKPKPKPKGFEKKNVKNKYKETLALKQKEKVLKKKKQKSKEGEEEEEEKEEADNVEIQLDDSTNEEDEEVEEEEEEENDDEEVEEEEKEENDDEAAFKRKCKELDERKKNRLFVKLKKKIKNEAQIKELHPDIRGVIFPRKKNSRWCWAVFASQERANAALKQMVKNKEVLVSKPNPYEQVHKKQKEKLKTVLRKKEAKKKLKNLWM